MTANTNPLSYNQYIQTMAGLAVYQADQNNGVWEFSDAPPELQVPQMLNYAELRIQRDLDPLCAYTSNSYTLTPGVGYLPLPVDDFIVVESVQLTQQDSAGNVIDATPLIQVSVEFLQNCYGGLSSSAKPKYYAMTGDNFADGANTYNKIRFGPFPSFAFTVGVRGIIRLPSLYLNSVAGVADTGYTYISTYYPDMLLMASMIYITMFQRNFGGTSDDPQMGMNYEKQYQILKATAVMEENRKKGMGSAWSGYSTPVSATPTR